MRNFINSAMAAAVVLVATPASASINFVNPYVFASQAEAEKGISLPLYGGSDREVSYVSVRVYRWVQKEDDAYAFEPAPEVAVFPQMVRLEPSTPASVRLAWSRSAPVDERYYRIVMEEFDRPDGTNVKEDKAFIGFRVRPRASLPLVIYGRDNVVPAQLTASLATKMVEEEAEPAADGTPTPPKKVEQRIVRIGNNGATYGRVIGFRDNKGAVHDAMIYVLPGGTVELPIPGIEDLTGLELLYTSGRAEHVRKPNDPARSVVIN